MQIVYFIIFWLAGVIAGAFTITNILIILFFGIPNSLKLNKLGMLKSLAPLRLQLISLMISLSIFAFTYWLVHEYFHRCILAFNIGVGMSFLNSLSKVGANNNNVSDFNEVFESYIKTDSSAKGLSEIKNDSKVIQPSLTHRPPILSEQNMRPGFILFVSSNQFPLGLKMISTKVNADNFILEKQNSTGQYRIKIEIEIKTGNTELMSHDLDGILESYRYSKESYSYTISKMELKDLLLTKKIPFEYFD
jgi:hypothetical protein